MTTQTLPSPLHGWRLFSLLAVAVLLMSALILLLEPNLVEATRSAIRATARSSFVLFLLAFTASAWAVLLPSPRVQALGQALVRERRYIGLAFAFSHLVHALLIYRYGQLNPQFWPGRSALGNLPGSVGYLFILLLALTSFKGPAALLGRRAWKRLHTTGMWVLAAIFAYSNFKRIPLSAWYALPFAITGAAMALNLLGKLAQANKRRQRQALNTR
ncbi:hypothetical protein [Pseudomonas chlororaphis]|uniref:Inner membrane protein n=1 Tax=Pseudomonas chlororaphis TaxID=587753 RepID=A0A1Q8EQ68_9PSED|nr:hypothetical protein [Pseudomonas chlororaphis]OLF53941.1 hypothetical protein BTN82_12840 [Pseudomonas chlororaphis]